MSPTLTWYDYIIFAGMLVLSTTIGIYFGCFGTKQSTIREYLMGSKNMKVVPIAVSVAVRYHFKIISPHLTQAILAIFQVLCFWERWRTCTDTELASGYTLYRTRLWVFLPSMCTFQCSSIYRLATFMSTWRKDLIRKRESWDSCFMYCLKFSRFRCMRTRHL